MLTADSTPLVFAAGATTYLLAVGFCWAAYAALAGFLLRTGDPSAAEAQLAEALRLRPHAPELHARLATLRRLREVL